MLEQHFEKKKKKFESRLKNIVFVSGSGRLQLKSSTFASSPLFLLQEFLELTVETDSEQPLPPPKEVAKKLKLLAIQTLQSWQSSYGTAYKKLALGYHFLKQVKKVRVIQNSHNTCFSALL